MTGDSRSNSEGSSRLSQLYELVYARLCGRHPHVRLWHSQYLCEKDLNADLRRVLGSLSGVVLDVGCGNNPYRSWIQRTHRYIGLDIRSGEGVDIVVRPGEIWPVEDASCDAVLCTQVLEHVENLDLEMAEIYRIMRPGGTLVLTVPFIYNVHGAPHDYRRLSTFGVKQLVGKGYDILELKPQGGIGSACGGLLLNWIHDSFNLTRPLRILKGLLLPAWMLFSLFVNLLGLLLDILDRTSSFYGNTLLVARKNSAGGRA